MNKSDVEIGALCTDLTGRINLLAEASSDAPFVWCEGFENAAAGRSSLKLLHLPPGLRLPAKLRDVDVDFDSYPSRYINALIACLKRYFGCNVHFQPTENEVHVAFNDTITDTDLFSNAKKLTGPEYMYSLFAFIRKQLTPTPMSTEQRHTDCDTNASQKNIMNAAMDVPENIRLRRKYKVVDVEGKLTAYGRELQAQLTFQGVTAPKMAGAIDELLSNLDSE